MNDTTDPRIPSTRDGDDAGDRPAPGPTGPDAEAPSPWAPWWVYLVVILGGNLLRGAVMNDRGLPPAVQIAAALGLAAVLALIVTVVWRAMQGGRR